MQFTFPGEVIETVGSFQQVKQIFNFLILKQKLSSFVSYVFRMVRGTYIYCLCKYCSARVVFKKNQTIFVLFKSHLFHRHNKTLSRKKEVIESIRDCPSFYNLSQIKKTIMGRYNISSPTFYRYFRESQASGHNIQEVLGYLQEEGIFGVSINENNKNQFPQAILLTSQLMIQTYFANGKNVKFDLTYNLIREKPSENGQYAVGFFVTLNKNMRIQPVCFVIMSQESKEIFIKVFQQFSILMKSPPNVITTDQQKAIKYALQQLSERGIFSGFHFIDLFHVLRNAKKSLFRKELINSLISLSRSENIIEYQIRVKTCLQKFSGRDRSVFQSFEQKMQKCCIGVIPQVFVGLSCSTNSCEKMNDMIKKRIPYSQKYLDVLCLVPKFLVKILNYPKQKEVEKMKIEQFIAIREIQQLRYRLCKQVFGKLMAQLFSSMKCLINITSDPHVFHVTQEEFDDNQFFAVSFYQQDSKWSCQCRLTEKIGLPCAHIIKVLLLTKQKIISSINYWWISEKTQNKQKQKTMIQFPRKTRRSFR